MEEEQNTKGSQPIIDVEDSKDFVNFGDELLESIQSTATLSREQKVLITQLRRDPHLMELIFGQLRHQGDQDESPSSSNPTQKVIDTALSNAVILGKILDSTPSPKNLRLVSKSWNDVILSGNPRLKLKLNSIPFSENIETFLDSRLVKSLILSQKHYDDLKRYVFITDPQFLTQLPHLCRKFGSNIQEISVDWSLNSFALVVPTLYEILGNDCTPNIKNLSIKVSEANKVRFPIGPILKTIPMDEIQRRIPIKPTLNRIKLVVWNDDENLDESHFLSSIFRDLLAAAPKLEEFEMDCSFCPSLASNKELKSFKFDFVHRGGLEKLEEEKFNLRDLSNILEEVKDSLEILKLDAYPDSGTPAISLMFPAMPNLKVFFNKNSTVFSGRNFLKQLQEGRMTSLIRLKICVKGTDPDKGDGFRILQKMADARYEKVFGKIKRLGLIGVEENSIQNLFLLKRVFTGLERLDLNFGERWVGGSGSGTWVGEALNYCSDLGLRHLNVKASFVYPLSEMLKGLWEGRKQMFPGLKTLVIRNFYDLRKWTRVSITEYWRWEERQKLREVLILTKGMEYVIVEGFWPKNANAIGKFISDNELPVDMDY